VPPHLHRRTPLRQPQPPRRELLLLPPHHPQTNSARDHPGPPPHHRTPFRIPPPITRRPLRHPIRHRNGPATHSQQRPGPQTSRPTPLRPPNRQPESTQTAAPQGRRRARTSPGIHHRPRTRNPGTTNRNPRKEKLHRPPTRRIPKTKKQPRTRSPTPNPSHCRHPVPSTQYLVPGLRWTRRNQ
jgi:hypothetical protein